MKLEHSWETLCRSWGASSALGKFVHQCPYAKGFSDACHEDNLASPGSTGKTNPLKTVECAEAADGRQPQGIHQKSGEIAAYTDLSAQKGSHVGCATQVSTTFVEVGTLCGHS